MSIITQQSSFKGNRKNKNATFYKIEDTACALKKKCLMLPIKLHTESIENVS